MPSARDIKAGGAYIELGVKMSALTRGLKSAQQRLQAFSGKARAAAMGFAAAGGAVIAPLAASIRTFSQYGDGIAKMARRTGWSTEAVSAYAHAAELAGTSQDTLERGIQGLNRMLLNAKLGLTSATDALDEVGLSYDDLAGKDPQQQFNLLAERIAGIEDPATRSAVAMRIFGKSGAELLPMLAMGKGGLEGAAKEARDLGLVLDGKTAAAAERVTDQLARMWGSVKGLQVSIASALEPTVSGMANVFLAASRTVREFVERNKPLVVTAAKVGAALVAVGGTLAAVAVAASGLSFIVGGLASALAALPLVAVVAALGAFAAGVFLVTDSIMGMLGKANGGWAEFIGRIKVGGASLNAWMQTIWLYIFEGWERTKTGIIVGWESLILSAQTAGSKIYQALARVAQSIATAFWNAIQGIADSISWLAEKALTTGYALDLVDDAELVRGMQTIERLRKGMQDFTDRQKGMVDDLYGGAADSAAQASEARWAEYFKKREDREREAARRMETLHTTVARVFAEDAEQADPLAGLISGAKDKLAELRGRFQELMEGAKIDASGLSGGKGKPGIAGPEGANEQATAKSAVAGTFNAMAARSLQGSGMAERTAKASEETARNTRRLVDEAREGGGPAFA